jgi:hypothetical protein
VQNKTTTIMKKLWNKYWMLFTCLLLIFGAGALNGVMDTLQFRYGTSVFPKRQGETFLGKDRYFWDPDVSWKNKYKDWPSDQRPAFPGATTWAVAFTDAWHLAQSMMLLCFHFSIVLLLVYHYRFPRWLLLVAVVPLNWFFGLAFTIMFGKVLRDRNRA